MVLAEAGASGRDFVLRGREIGAQADRFVLGRAHTAQREIHARQRGGAIDEAEALRHGDFERQPQQLVEHAGGGLSGVVLDRHDAEKAARARPRRAEFDRFLPETDAAIGQIRAEILHREQQWAHLAVVERTEKLERLRTRALCGLVHAQQARGVAAQCRQQRIARHVELAQFITIVGLVIGSRAPERTANAIDNSDAPLQRTADKRQEQVVDVKPLGRKPCAPRRVEPP